MAPIRSGGWREGEDINNIAKERSLRVFILVHKADIKSSKFLTYKFIQNQMSKFL